MLTPVPPQWETAADPRPLVGAMSQSLAAVAATAAVIVGLSLPLLQWGPSFVETAVESTVAIVLSEPVAVEEPIAKAEPVVIERSTPPVDDVVEEKSVPVVVESKPTPAAPVELTPEPVVETPPPVIESAPPAPEEETAAQPIEEKAEPVVEPATVVVENADVAVGKPAPVVETIAERPPAQRTRDLETVVWDEDERTLFREAGVTMTIAGQARDRRLLNGAAPHPATETCGDAAVAVVVIRFEVRADGTVKNDAYYEQTASCRDRNRSAMAAVRVLRFAPLPTGSRAGQWAVATISFNSN